MNKYIVVVAGEPYSVFFEILFKSIKLKKIKKPYLLVCSKKLLIAQMERLRFNFNINVIEKKNIKNLRFKNNHINILDVKFKFKKAFDKINYSSTKYIEKCFKEGLHLVKGSKCKILINGPVSKKYFLKKKFLGMTEYFAQKTGKKDKEVMLIYNNRLSVSPITTHLPIQNVAKKISIKKIINNVTAINSFFKSQLKKKAKFAITGLNPHCETVKKFSEEKKIILPAIKILKKKILKLVDLFQLIQFF